jgi:choline dehydrogenase-like flavoprotein
MQTQYDVAVVGGGAAGLSGALALSRARRSVLVVDAGDPRNAPAGRVHNYLAREATPPAELLGASPFAVVGALLWRQGSTDVTLFTHPSPAPSEDETEQLAARGITVVAGEVAGSETTGHRLSGVRLVDGRVVPRTALVVAPRFTARSEVLAALGLEAAGLSAGAAINADLVAEDTRLAVAALRAERAA